MKVRDVVSHNNYIMQWWCCSWCYRNAVQWTLLRHKAARAATTTWCSLVTTVALSLVLLAAGTIQPVQGGMCWTMVSARTGRCMELVADRISQESCCVSPNAVSAAWSEEDLESGTLFFWRALNGGVPCQPCQESCLNVVCGAGKTCELRGGRPRCVCDPMCRRGGRHRGGGGPVCGTDGRSYRNICRLRKRVCRKQSNLALAYQGQCQSSCERVHCPNNKKCVVDQNLTPHCVRCTRRCSQPSTQIHDRSQRSVCGTDGRTYISACHLKEAACRKGKAIPMAYTGRCNHAASCDTIRCLNSQQCLVGMHTGLPRCVTCGMRCSNNVALGQGGPICGTNNLTYPNWCYMMQDACATGYVIETKHPGNCTSSSAISANTSIGVAAATPTHRLTESNSAVSNAFSEFEDASRYL